MVKKHRRIILWFAVAVSIIALLTVLRMVSGKDIALGVTSGLLAYAGANYLTGEDICGG